MNLLAPVSSIMSRDLITIGPEDTLKKVETIFQENRIHHLPVIDQGKLVGMVSSTDYLYYKRGFKDKTAIDQQVGSLQLGLTKVKDVMTKGLAVLQPEDRINVALEVFNENLFHAIPIEENGVLRGIVTTYDVIKNLATDGNAVAEYE